MNILLVSIIVLVCAAALAFVTWFSIWLDKRLPTKQQELCDHDLDELLQRATDELENRTRLPANNI